MEFTIKEIADEVQAARQRIHDADPDAYGGYIADAACHAVARRRDMKATDVLRAWRAYHPLRNPGYGPLPSSDRKPKPEAVALA